MASAQDGGRTVAKTAQSGSKARQFLEETWVELRYKVTWPRREQLIKSTSVVLTVVAIIAVFNWVLDTVFTQLISKWFLNR